MTFDFDLIDVMSAFVESSKALADAAALCDDDPIKQEMVAFLAKDFQNIQARSEGVKIMVAKNFSESKDFIMDEVREITRQNNVIAEKIRDTLEGLS